MRSLPGDSPAMRELATICQRLDADGRDCVLLYAMTLSACEAHGGAEPPRRPIAPVRQRGEAVEPDPALSTRLDAMCEPRERAVWADVLARRVSAGDGEGVRAVERLALHRLGEGAAA